MDELERGYNQTIKRNRQIRLESEKEIGPNTSELARLILSGLVFGESRKRRLVRISPRV
jgi:hypothetical protein